MEQSSQSATGVMKHTTKVALKRDLGLWSALALVIGTIIGSGIFFKQASVLDAAGGTTMALGAWLLGGIITLTSGLSIAEIGSQMPETGGLYHYMENMYNKFWGFLSGWMQIIVYGPSMIASLALYLGVLVTDFFGIGNKWLVPVGLIAIAFIGLINFLSNRFGASIAIIITLCKLVPITMIIVFGLFFGNGNAFGQSVQHITSQAGSGFGVAVLATLFAYDGWVLVANMGGEIKNPKKMLPKAIGLGILLVSVIYLLVTFGIYRVMPAAEIHRLGQNATPAFAKLAFGGLGGKILNIGIIISILGCMNGKIMTFPRIMWKMADNKELPFSDKLAYINKKTLSPIYAIVTVLGIAMLLVLFANPDRLSDLCITTVYIFYVMAFVGLFKLRRREQTTAQIDKQSFRVPFYPLTPIIAILGAGFVIFSEVINDPMGILFSIIIVASGIPIYYYFKKKHAQPVAH
ncbi:amino acid transporter [Agrilactobacillus composti DSM 18527 = JCM 14202]|uniref:Amino acid transporter n=2 Tax=Agrilactobacillus TaxID=2767875 RepID=A0A0R1XJX2_9LACO|nr:amino acid transporter [Agrilactobacillus composti DSM 18527 = JCM 14202]